MRVTGVDACRRGWVAVTLEVPAAGRAGRAGVRAAAVAWSAWRIATGHAVILPARPQRDRQGREIAIRY